MPLASYKDLCLDVGDLEVAAAFWAPVLGLAVGDRWDDVARLDGPTDGHRVWLNRVPEPHTTKNRVHVDVHAADDVPPGATPLSAPGEHPWRVVADPDGNELCVFVREEVPAYRLYEVGVDVADAARSAAWWGEVLGVAPHHGDDAWHWLEDVPGMPFGLVFNPVPEARPGRPKNRVHWDVDVAGPDGVRALVAHGARVVREPGEGHLWTVMADPDDVVFCVFEP